MKLIIYRGAIALVLLVLVQSCYKIDVDWLNKRKDKDQFYFLPEEFTQRGQVWFKSFFKGNNPRPERIFVRTWGGDDSLLINIKWIGERAYFLSNNDTCFTIILNHQGYVKEVIPGNFSRYIEVLEFQDHLNFEYVNNKIVNITFNNSDLAYNFNYDDHGNCSSIYWIRSNQDNSSPLGVVDFGLFEHDYNQKVNQQFYFFSLDILLITQLQILDFLGLVPGMQPQNLQNLSRLTRYHNDELENLFIIDHKLDKYGNLVNYSYLEEEYKKEYPSQITWKKFKK